ncbi:MAG: glycosyltransferase family 2 protein [Ignavibacteriales bacterium]|nr:glycosyltransferase family 2 protein [Ignavibacteriales bacterium]
MLTIIIPIYNEESILPELHNRLENTLASVAEEFEIILVDDGSRDRSYELMKDIHRSDSRFKLIRLSRNFGHQIALSAALDAARGDAVILMDGDLQDPPELFSQMIEQWKSGAQVVFMVKKSRKENILKRAAFRLFYKILHSLSSIEIPMHAGNFSLLDRRVVDVLRKMPERHRYLSGLRAWAGFTQVQIGYHRDARFAGKPQMSLRRLIKLALDGIFSFSNVPLRAAIYLGLSAALIAFGGGLYVIYEKVFTDKAILGWASTIVSITFLGGLILMTLGIIGEYVGRIYDEVKQRPLYVIREMVGFDSSAQ